MSTLFARLRAVAAAFGAVTAFVLSGRALNHQQLRSTARPDPLSQQVADKHVL
jgi:hypothetical protein